MGGEVGWARRGETVDGAHCGRRRGLLGVDESATAMGALIAWA